MARPIHLFALLLLAAAPPLAAQSDSAAAVDRIFAVVNADSTPGCVVSVMRAGRPVLERVYGLADMEHGVPLTRETILEAGSVSKQFTAAAVLLLAQDGRLSLDDDVRRYLPELPVQRTPITVRMLLNHTSGLRDWGNVVALSGWPRGTRAYTQADALAVIARQRGLNHAPGAEYLYSNSNYTLAALVVERVSGMTLAEFTRRRLFEPLGMERTSWRDDYTRIVPGRATGYARGDDGVWHSDMPFENTIGHNALLTTVGDLLRWNENLDDPRVGGAAFARAMQTPGRVTSGRMIGYALGLEVGTQRGHPALTHGGATAGYRAFLGRYPAQRLSIAILCNAGRINTEEAGEQVADVFLGPDLPTPPAPPLTPISLPAERLAALAGSYRVEATGVPATLTADSGRLRVNGGPALLPVAPGRFRSADGARELWFDADARAARLRRPAGDTVRLVAVSAWRPAGAELAPFTGRYTSAEADAVVDVLLQDGALVVRRRPGDAVPLEPAYPDALLARDEGWIVRFQRDAGGRVTGMSIGSTRAREVAFARERR